MRIIMHRCMCVGPVKVGSILSIYALLVVNSVMSRSCPARKRWANKTRHSHAAHGVASKVICVAPSTTKFNLPINQQSSRLLLKRGWWGGWLGFFSSRTAAVIAPISPSACHPFPDASYRLLSFKHLPAAQGSLWLPGIYQRLLMLPSPSLHVSHRRFLYSKRPLRLLILMLIGSLRRFHACRIGLCMQATESSFKHTNCLVIDLIRATVSGWTVGHITCTVFQTNKYILNGLRFKLQSDKHTAKT